MRKARLKESGQRAYYHVMSRVLERRFLLKRAEKEKFRTLMRQLEAFCGVHVLTYAVLENHFHILLEVPEPKVLSDTELLARLAILYDATRVEEVGAELARLRAEGNEAGAERLRTRFTHRMYDLSEFVKALKQIFTQWYNRRAKRRGTLWEDRFKSVLIEPSRAREGQWNNALLTMAAYIDLNAVRAGRVSDPKDYRYCGYGEACGGEAVARAGLERIFEAYEQGSVSWDRVQGQYRSYLYETGRETTEQHGFTRAAVEAVLAAGGRLSSGQLLRCRVRYFSDGVVLGSQAYVDDVFTRYRGQFGVKRRSGARAIRGAESGGLFTLRDLRLTPIALPTG